MNPNLAEAGRSSVAGCSVEEQILDAGLQVFLRQGYAATKDDDVALAAGLPVDQVRSHFATKEILFCMVLDRESERARHGYLGGIPKFDTALDAFRFGAEQYRRGVLDTELTGLWRCANEEVEQSPQLIRFFITTDNDTQIQAFTRHILLQWQDSGILNMPNPQHCARQFIGMLQRALIDEAHILGAVADDIDDYIESCCVLMANTYGTA